MNKKKIRLNILGLSYSQTQSGAYALVLAEEEGERRIPIIIGGVEAQSIAIKLEGLEPPRPLTHDLFLNFARAFHIELQEVVIYKLEEGIFYSELVCIKNNDTLRIDSRTSDAVALALRFNCPIFTYEEILSKAGIVLDFGDTKEPVPSGKPTTTKPSGNPLASKSLDELQVMLNEAVDAENYEKASEIRDEIKRREK
ncbi:bifunctional nuclease family protein [Alkaliflexus imshenetskii]|uniref:bifunctional nuclease family protein n=1 Tax=Alkaliflexus imshenetskii TaxID=286730 RepID=UPI00047932ED|nr:bifunctional nuclease family protein [Alkaliflexus imshenetskii]